MYTSSGGGILGAGGHASVRGAAFALLRQSDVHWSEMTRLDGEPSLPSAGSIRFTVRRPAETRSIELPESELARGRSPLSPFYASMQAMLTEIRLIEERRAAT
jgi:hypothetical protein